MPMRHIEKQLAEQGVLGNFPRFGKLRKGGEKNAQGHSGKDLAFFRLTLEPQYEEVVRPAFEQLFGTQPTEFRNVLIAADHPDQGFKYWYEEWAHARLLRRCDGEEIVVSFDEGNQKYNTEPQVCSCHPLDRDCDEKGYLDIVIPELFDLTGMWGKITVLTGSIYDIVALRSSMRVASVFTAQNPNIAFWSIPFRIGRALRTVPVTINGKRSMKPMSLLYADIEPEFNKQVFNPMLTAPAQRILAELSAGEIPEIKISQAAAWDRDYVKEQTMHLFDHENHLDNTLDKLIAEGNITETMEDEEVIQTLQVNRQQRAAEKQREQAHKNASKTAVEGSNSSAGDEQVQVDLYWAKDAKTATALVAKASKTLKLTHADVIQALQWAASDYHLQNIGDFIGTKDDAWAACVAFAAHYDADQVAGLIPDENNPVRLRALELMSVLDIPF